MTLKKFFLYTKPHVADPAWQVPVVDMTDSDNPISFCSTEQLEKVVRQLSDDRIRAEGHQEGVKHALKVLGVSGEEYIKKLMDKSK